MVGGGGGNESLGDPWCKSGDRFLRRAKALPARGARSRDRNPSGADLSPSGLPATASSASDTSITRRSLLMVTPRAPCAFPSPFEGGPLLSREVCGESGGVKGRTGSSTPTSTVSFPSTTIVRSSTTSVGNFSWPCIDRLTAGDAATAARTTGEHVAGQKLSASDVKAENSIVSRGLSWWNAPSWITPCMRYTLYARLL